MTKKLDPATAERIFRLIASHREDRGRSISALYERVRRGEKELEGGAIGLYLLERIPVDLMQRAAEELERTGELSSDVKAQIEEALDEWRGEPS